MVEPNKQEINKLEAYTCLFKPVVSNHRCSTEPFFPIACRAILKHYIAWATTLNSAAYRSPMHGSRFAVALYEVFIQCAQADDLHTMMLNVNNIICSMEGVDMKIGCSTHQCLEMVERLRFSIYFQ